MSFTEAFTQAILRGQEYRRRKREEDEAVEDRDIEKESLQLRLKQLKIQEKVQARGAAAENYKLLEGMPEANFPWDGTGMKSAPSALGPGFGTMEVPERSIPTLDIPGIDELGVPGISVKPRTMEQQLAEVFATARTRALATPRAVGRYSDLVVANPDGTTEVLHEGDDAPEVRRAYTTRGPDGVTQTEYLTPEEIEQRGPAVRHPMPDRSNGGSSSRLTPEEIQTAVEGFQDGTLPVDKIPTSADGIRLLGALKKAGVNVTKAANDLRAFRTFMTGLNSGQRQEMLAAADTAEQNLNALEQINTRAGNPRMWTPGVKDTIEMQSAAKAAVEALAVIKAGGSQPNNAAIERAEKELSAGLLSGALGPKILRLKEALKYRTASIRGSFVGTDSTGMQPAPAPGIRPQSSTGTGRSAADVKAALTAQGRADDDNTVAAVMANPDAMKALFEQVARK